MSSVMGCVPYFEVFDMMASRRFYCDVLGFEVVYASPEVTTKEGTFSHFMRLRLGAIDLMLNTAYDSDARPVDRSEPRWAGCKHVALYVDLPTVEDVEALFVQLTGRGLHAPAPSDTDYGYRAFTANDPDGHGLRFHAPLPGTPEAVRRATARE